MNKEFYKKLSDNIKLERFKKSLSRDLLAKKSNISQMTIVNLENDSSKVTLKTLVSVLDALDVNILDIFKKCQED